ncbi:probable protein phosphatase 2C 62 [Solanum stenotomum]|uniref:probable protein phosphatase 2C 62 n=1 Tax=Solanum stenotomum TaxID=172797 RepID=UPI0020D1C535|nr:probable protein phosphatase 2C 62 [Solanum stenotomum]
MADSLCKFLDARCITGSHFLATYFSAQKPLLFPTLVRRKRRRKSLHIAFCSTSISPNLDVVSTHEYSDGTLLFRFGDPSEIEKEDELEESLLGVEEVGRDSEEEFSVVKVLDGDNEREVIVKKVEREARGEAVTVVTDAGVSESVLIGNGRSDFVEVETGLSENFLGDSADEIGLISPEGIQNESVAEVGIENAGHVEEIFEKKDDSEASVPPPPENSIPSLEVEEKMMDQSSDESFEELDDDNSLLLSSPAAMPVYSDSVNTKEIEESEGEGSSQFTENDGGKDCCDDSTHSMENGAASVDIEAADNDIEIVQHTEQISENIDPILEGPVESVPEGINLGNTETVADEISPENAPEGINLGNTETVVDEISPENAPEGINLGNTETVVDEISSDNAPEGIDPGNTETVVDEISSDNAPEGNDQGNSETVVDEISLENSLDGIDLGNTETVVDEISLENSLDLGNTETVVDEISLENAPDGLDLGNTETVVDKISPENALGGINLGNTETVVDEISPENVDIRHLSMDAEDQSTEVLNFENDNQTELSNLSVDTEDQASRNSTFKDSDETDVIEVMPASPKLEAEPVFDEEVDHNLISESNESESPLPSDENLPSLSLEDERKEDVENTEIMEVYGHEVVEDKSSDVLDSSKEATPAAAELILSSGATLLQYPSKAFAGGHEAYFIACGKWLGVADAVGSWSLEGSDPGVYAQELMQNSESIVSQCDTDSINDPKQVLNLSVSKTDSPGSSTVLISHFDGKVLHVANIGDSGFIIVRNGSVYRKSSPMLHEFNLPIQIEKGDDPSQLLEEYKIELDEGDIIVTATDALFDNLYDQEIVSIVSRSLEADKSPQEIAEILATRVQQVGSSASGRSPFADAAQAAGYVGYTGGKRDDVAVIVSLVQKVIVSNDN